MKPIRTAVFPVGGLGTRFLPITKSIPKEMLPIVDKPLIQYSVEEAVKAGIEHLIFVTSKGKTSIEDHFDRDINLENLLKSKNKHEELNALSSIIPDNIRISYTRQSEPKGLGHAIWCAKDLVGNEPFAILSADDFISSKNGCLSQMVSVYNKTGSNMFAVKTVPKDQTYKYGIIKPGKIDGRSTDIEDMIEKPPVEKAPSEKAIIGRYILSSNIFKYLDQQKIGAGGEIQLTDAMVELLEEERFIGYEFEGQHFDCGSKIGLIKANTYQSLNRNDLSDEYLKYLKSI